ncbi:MAG TPA: hypothetical protein VK125_02055 [Bacillota bacterium]|nr:hypothetical protein [Bacillota bacterium]
MWGRFIPYFEFIVYDFSLESDAEIFGDEKLQAYLHMIKTIREPNMDELIKNVAHIWYMLELDTTEYFKTLLIYLLNERKNISLEGLVKHLNAEGREVAMSTAEQLWMEGREEGREKGRVEGREEAAHHTAKRLLALNMDIEKIALATALPIEDVKRIASEIK